MRSIVVAAIWLIAIASPALAQSKVYIAGDVFADIKRLSGDPDSAVLNATAPGGGVRLGAFLSSLWSLELGVDLGAESENVVKRTPTVSRSPRSRPVRRRPTTIAPPIVFLPRRC